MKNPDKQARKIQDMFKRIARRYDLMNRLMTAGQDVRWRREVIQRARLADGALLLDLGAGTGDLARTALLQQPGCRPVAMDFTLEMMRVGNQRGHLEWSAADALNLPLPAGIFDAAVSGFLMRNVADIQQAMGEQYRILAGGGRIVILDTTRPRRSLIWPLLWLYFHLVIPTLGLLITGQRAAYTYLPTSTEKFVSAEELADSMQQAGFTGVGFRRLMFGTIAIHWGEK